MAKSKRKFHPCLSKWRERIDAAEKRGSFNYNDRDRAVDWDTCACGEARAKYPQLVHKRVPADGRLRMLGANFAAIVWGAEDFSGARDVLTRIEARLVELAAA